MNQLFSYQKLNDYNFGIISNVNLNLQKKQIHHIGRLFLNELLVIFSNQSISIRKFASICYAWGRPQIFNPLSLNGENQIKAKKLSVCNLPGLIKVTSKKDQYDHFEGILSDVELEWHSDGSGKINPPQAIALYAQNVNENHHTDFLECVTAYQKLSYEDKKTVDNLNYIHLWNDITTLEYAKCDEVQLKLLELSESSYVPIKLPLINNSPGGHRGFRYNSRGFIKFENKTEKENKELRRWIESLLFKKEYVYTHHWKPGDVLFMDQTVMLHRRRKQDFSNRLLYRMQFDVSKLIQHV